MSKVADHLPPPRRGSPGATQDSNNKVKIPNGTKLARILEFWIYNVDKDGRFTAAFDPEYGKKVRVKFQFTSRPDIVLDRRFKFYLGEKSHWSLFLEALTGVEATKDTADHPSLQRGIDLDAWVNEEVFITTQYKEPYTDIVSVMAKPGEEDFGGAPAHQPAALVPAKLDADAIRERLKAALRTPALLKGEIDKAVITITGSPSPKSILTPQAALEVIAEIERRIDELDQEIPF